jgi:CheY-like chemotaxis protein
MQVGVEAQRAVENRRIFVIDSDEVRRAALQFMLADENETHEFAALEPALAKGATWRPDLVLVGGALLAQDGAQAVTARLRAAWPDAPLIVVRSAGAVATDDTPATSAADDLLGPVLELGAVRRKADRWLGRKPVLRIAVVAR